MVSKKRPTLPLQDPENALGKAYANSLNMKAQSVLSGYVLTLSAREHIARDLRALAYIAEHCPEAFAGVPTDI